MVVWINGAFGVGKTTVARRLVAQLEGASIVDPEHLGFVLQRLPWRRRGDFQDMPAWRWGTVRAVRLAARLRRHVVVPMTLVNPGYFEEIVEVLRRHEEVRHFALVASPETIAARLRGRGTGGWAVQQVERCTTALREPMFGRHVQTEGRGVEAVVEQILRQLAEGGRGSDPPRGRTA